MKKTLLLLSIIVVLFSAGCKKDHLKIDNTSSQIDLIEKNKANRIYTDTTKKTVSSSKAKQVNGVFDGSPTTISYNLTYTGNGYYTVKWDASDNKNEIVAAYLNSLGIPGGPQISYTNTSGTINTSVNAYLPAGAYEVSVRFNDAVGQVVINSEQFIIRNKPAAPAGMVGLYRYDNPTTGKHFTTSDWEELASGSQGYRYQKLTGFASSTYIPGTTPVYRFYSDALGNHFYTTVSATPDNYVSEGIVGYVATAPYSNLTTSLIDYYSNLNGGDHVVAFDDEIIVSPYVREGTIGYVQPPPIDVPYPKDGYFVNNTNTGQVFLFFEGQLRYIPTQATLYGLFSFYTGLLRNYTTAELNTLSVGTGTAFTSDNGLINDTNTGRVYLREGNVIRWIHSSDIFSLYHFNSAAITNVHGISNYILGNPITN